jgi:hypothetical protein
MYPPNYTPMGQPFQPVYAPVPLGPPNPNQMQYSYSQYGNYQPFMNQPVQPVQQYPYNYNMNFGAPAPQGKFNPYANSPVSYNNPYGDITGMPAMRSNGLVFRDTPPSNPYVSVETVDSSTYKGYDDNYIYDNVTGEYRPANGDQFFAQTDEPQSQQQSQPMTMFDYAYMRQQQNTYNPYAYSYGYSYGPQGTFNPMAYQQQMNNGVEMNKLRYRIAMGYLGKEVSEEQMDQMFNPQNPVNTKTPQEQKEYNLYMTMRRYSELGMRPVQPMTEAQLGAMMLANARQSFDERYGDNDMYEFFNKNSWRIFTEIHEHENYKDHSRDLRSTYNSPEYNELLNMHNSSNPWINQLMDDSRYDNNQDDLEVGMNLAFERFKRRETIMNGPLDANGKRFISSPEVQQKREAWTKKILDEIMKKGRPPESG